MKKILFETALRQRGYRSCKRYADAVEEILKEEGLSEGIADFFALLYLLKSVQRCGDEKIRLAKRRYNAWKKRFGSAWPYANALYFYRLGNEKMDFSPDYSDYELRCVDKLKRVFCATSDPAFAVKLMKE